MILHAESDGQGSAVVMLHGLMGSSVNWRTVRGALAARWRIHCLDLPNHGRSAHKAHVDLSGMAQDVRDTLDALAITRAVVVGHSLGGKVAMQLASETAGRVAGLLVVDISPRAFQPVHLFMLRACLALDLSRATRRSDLDHALAAALPHRATRAFLLQNVVRDASGRFGWRVPLQTLIDNYRTVSDAPPLKQPYPGPALFLAGAESPFRVMQDASLIRDWFPSARVSVMAGAGHLVHIEQPEAFLTHVRGFLEECYPEIRQ